MGTTCSTSKIPQPPLPFIYVRLSTPPDTVFRPYSVITGEITLTPIVAIAPHAIEVSLFGQALTWYRVWFGDSHGNRLYKHWRDNAPLFEATSNLLPTCDSGQQTLEAGHTYTYPFCSFQQSHQIVAEASTRKTDLSCGKSVRIISHQASCLPIVARVRSRTPRRSSML
jgi:hypothetical protein